MLINVAMTIQEYNPSKSKTECVMFTKARLDKDSVAPIVLNGDPLPWVETVKHLGNTLE